MEILYKQPNITRIGSAISQSKEVNEKKTEYLLRNTHAFLCQNVQLFETSDKLYVFPDSIRMMIVNDTKIVIVTELFFCVFRRGTLQQQETIFV
jgi:hypothetical protein